jgi:hypothetical protein
MRSAIRLIAFLAAMSIALPAMAHGAMWLHSRPSQSHLNDCNCAAPPVEQAKAGLASV